MWAFFFWAIKMKFFTNVFIVLFISLAAYLLLNEKGVITKKTPTKRVAEITGSNSKLIGQRPARDPFPFELQRQRINSETVYKFQSNDSGESYELEESDLDKFGVQLIDFKNVNRNHIRPADMINDRKVKRF